MDLIFFPKWLLGLFFGFQLMEMCAGQCPTGYNSMGGNCLMYSTTKYNWQDAMNLCTKDGATLFFVQKQSDWDVVVQNFQSQVATLWIGLRFDSATGTWSWADGSPFNLGTDWAPWYTGQPKTSSGACVGVKYDNTLKEQRWSMVSCTTTRLSPVCIKIIPTTIGTGTPFTFPDFANVTCPAGFISFGGQCMKFTQDPKSYDGANEFCAANNSNVLFTKEEWMWKYAEQYLQSQLSGAWFGLSYNTATQQFEWSDGSVLQPSDWNAWCEDQPGVPGTPDVWGGDCVNVMQNDFGEYCWYTADCSNGLAVVCILILPTTTAPTTTTTTSTSTTATTTTATTTTTTPTTPTTTTASTTTMTPTTTTTMLPSTSPIITAPIMTTTTLPSTSPPTMAPNATPSPTSTSGGQQIGIQGTSIAENALGPGPAVPGRTVGSTVTGCNPKYTGNFLPVVATGRLSHSPFQIVQNVNNSDCALTCIKEPQCGSFDWNTQTSECRLLQQQYNNDCTSFVPDPNYQHFDLVSVDEACYC